MPRVRGRRPGAYLTNGGTSYKMSVDRDRFAAASFGWTAASVLMPQLPRGFKPRHISGLSPTTGRRGIAVVPDVTAGVWTGATSTFDVEADDGTIDTMDILQRFGEKPVLP